jgi:tRNA G10  N-methylase Trm11
MGIRPKLVLRYSDWVTSKLSQHEPVHRWFLFPHSFSREIVEGLLQDWRLSLDSKLLDPFSGAGTTLLTAKQQGYHAIGYDISPLAVFASNVKVARYSSDIRVDWEILKRSLHESVRSTSGAPTDILRRAFTRRSWDALIHIRRSVAKVTRRPHRQLFELGLLVTLSKFSKARRTGGWLRWDSASEDWRCVIPSFTRQIKLMLNDLSVSDPLIKRKACRAYLADARALPARDQDIDAVITSPPYPNRHDYSRIFNIELSFAFLNDLAIKELRNQSFRSHVEAQKPNLPTCGYRRPRTLARILGTIEKRAKDRRVPQMIDGYFEDMYLHLASLSNRLKKDARLAYILGNVQYHGVAVPVDLITAEIGKNIGFKIEGLSVARYRGNSAQQMGEYGRRPSRETILVMSK